MATIADITGTYDHAALQRLTWPVVWNGAPDRDYEEQLAELLREAYEALRLDCDATAVEIREGRVVATVCESADV